MGPGGAVAVALEPFRVRLQRLLVSEVGIHARDHPKAALLGRRHHFAQHITRSEELTAMVVGHLGGIKRHDSAAIHQHGVYFQRGPVIHPGLRIDVQRVCFVIVDLAAASHGGVPRRILPSASSPRESKSEAAGSAVAAARNVRREISVAGFLEFIIQAYWVAARLLGATACRSTTDQHHLGASGTAARQLRRGTARTPRLIKRGAPVAKGWLRRCRPPG